MLCKIIIIKKIQQVQSKVQVVLVAYRIIDACIYKHIRLFMAVTTEFGYNSFWLIIAIHNFDSLFSHFSRTCHVQGVLYSRCEFHYGLHAN